MMWFVMGFTFAMGAITAMTVAMMMVIAVGAIATEREARRKNQEALEKFEGWEGTA